MKKIENFLKTNKDSHSKVGQLKYLSQSALIEEATEPYMIRSVLFLISLILASLIIWANFAEVQETAITHGQIVPSQKIQILQHLEGGTIKEVKVIEGEYVNEGQILLSLAEDYAIRDLESLHAKLLATQYQAVKLKAFVDKTLPDFSSIPDDYYDENFKKEQFNSYKSMVSSLENEKDIIREQIEQKEAELKRYEDKVQNAKKNMSLAKEELEIKETLYDKGHLSKSNLLQVKRDFNLYMGQVQENKNNIIQVKNGIEEYKERMESAESNIMNESYQQLVIAKGNIDQIQDQVNKIQTRLDRLDIRSTKDGYVKIIHYKTPGAIVDAGASLVEIVPTKDNLIVEVEISPTDIGHIKLGQKVNVKVSAYDFSRYGVVEGKIEYLSASSFISSEGFRYYKGRVSLEKNYIGNDSNENILLPGMSVQADISIGKKTVLEYIIKPIHDTSTKLG